MTVLLVACGGGLGAMLRFVVAHRYDARGPIPAGTLAVNVVGSFLLGAVSGVGLSPEAVALVGAGFCGGLTTYSAFAVQAHDRGRRTGSLYAVLTLGLGLGACALGFALGAMSG